VSASVGKWLEVVGRLSVGWGPVRVGLGKVLDRFGMVGSSNSTTNYHCCFKLGPRLIDFGSVWNGFGIGLGSVWERVGVDVARCGINLGSVGIRFGSLCGQFVVGLGWSGNDLGTIWAIIFIQFRLVCWMKT